MSVIYFQRLEDFPAIFLLLIFSLSELQYENILCIIYTLLNMWMCVLWPRICSTLVNVSCNLQKNVYPALIGWSIPYMTITSIWLLLLVRSCLCLLNFCLLDLSINNSGFICSSSEIYQFLPHAFLHSVIRCTCYGFLCLFENWVL